MTIQIYRCIKTNKLAQKFGENLPCAKVDAAGNAILPYQITSRYSENTTCPIGSKPFYQLLGLNGHNGEDWTAYRGEPVYFNVSIPGVRFYATTEVDSGGGVGVRVFTHAPVTVPREELPAQTSKHAMDYYEKQNGQMYMTFLYWHLKDANLAGKPLMQVGTFADGRPQMRPEVKFGDCIGFANSTGASTGDHVHFAMKWSASNSMTIGNDNGYSGAIDTARWNVNDFVGDIVEVVKYGYSVIELALKVIKEVQAYLASKMR